MQSFTRKTLCFVATFALTASAQTRVCIGGNLDHLTKTQKAACWKSASQVGSVAARFAAPSDWHFFVVCTGADWEEYASLSQRPAAELAEVGADTDLKAHTTFFRGDWLLSADTATVNRIVAHEVASATMNTTDQRLIRRMVAVWIPEEPKTPLTLEASR